MQALKKSSFRIGINTFYQLLGRFFTAVAGLLASKLIISSLGEIGYGEYQTVLSYATFFWLLTDFGLNAIVVGKMSADSSKEQKLFIQLLAMRTTLSTFLVFVALLVLMFLPYTIAMKYAVAIGLITIFTQGVKGAAQGLFQTRLRYEFTLISDVIGTSVFLGLTMWALQSNPSLLHLVAAFTIGQVVMAIISIFATTKLTKYTFDLDFAEMRKLMILTLPLGISLFFNVSNFKLDTILLSIIPTNMPNTEAVATYSLAYKFFEFGLIFPTFFMNAVYPMLMQSFAKSFEEFKRIFWLAASTLMIIGVLGTVLATILAPWLINVIAGEQLAQFVDSIKVLRILSVMLPVFFLSSLSMWTALVFNKGKVLIWVYAIGFVVNLATNFILIPSYSYYGAAITTGLSEVVILVLLLSQIFPQWREYNKA